MPGDATSPERNGKVSDIKYKLSGPLVNAETKRLVGILAQDKGVSIENYLGELVTEAIVPKWEEFQRKIAQQINKG